MDVMARRQALLNMTGLLPPMYRMCDYLQAQGDRAVIDTGVPGDNNLLGFDFAFEVDRFVLYRGFFTNYASETANCWRMSEGSSATYVLYTTNTKTGSSASAHPNYIGKKTTVIMDRTAFIMNTDTDTISGTIPTAVGTANNTTIYINSSRRYAQTRDDVIKWYYFKVRDNGSLIRNYVPCVRAYDNKAGFYDTVNHTFNPSIGSADFIAGYDE